MKEILIAMMALMLIDIVSTTVYVLRIKHYVDNMRDMLSKDIETRIVYCESEFDNTAKEMKELRKITHATKNSIDSVHVEIDRLITKVNRLTRGGKKSKLNKNKGDFII